MLLEIIFVVGLLLAAVSAVVPAEPYGRYGFIFLVIAVACLGARVFGLHA